MKMRRQVNRSGRPLAFNSKRRARMLIGLSASAAVAGSLAGVKSSLAATFTYTVTSVSPDNWSTSGNWSPALSSGNSSATTELDFGGNTTVFNTIGTLSNTNTNNLGNFTLGTLDLSGNATGSTATININGDAIDQLILGNATTLGTVNLVGIGAGMTYNVNAPILLGNATTFGGNGTANFNFAGGINSASGNMSLVKTGTSVLTLGSISSVGNLTIGSGSSGGSIVLGNSASLTATGSTINIGVGSGSVGLGNLTAAGGNGNISLIAAGGTINIGVILSGGNSAAAGTTGSVISGTGSVVISAGTLDISVNSTSSTTAAVTGTLDLSSASSATINVATLNLGTVGGAAGANTGTLKLGNGTTLTATNSILAGESSNGTTGITATITTGNNSTAAINTPTLALGDRKASGTLTLGSGSTLNLAGNTTAGTLLEVADWAGSLSSGTSFSSTADFTAGTLNGNLSGLIIALGQNTSSSGNVSGSVLLGSNANHLVINRVSGSPVIIAQRGVAGTDSITGNLTIGNLDGTSSITASGSTTAIAIGNVGGTGAGTNVSGTLNLNGGNLTIYTTGSAIAGGNGTSTVNFNGTTLIAGNSSTTWITGLTSANLVSGANGGGFFNSNGNNITIPQAFSGNGNFTKLGGGVLTLTGNNTFTGSTFVNAGTLALNNSAGTVLGNTAVSVAGGATLLATGNATIGAGGGTSLSSAGGTTSGTQGTISLVNGSINTLTVNGNLSLGSGSNGSIINLEINSAGGADLLNATGTAIVSGNNTINVTTLGTLTSGNYTLITSGGGLGSGFQLGSLGGAQFGGSYTLSGNSTAEILTVVTGGSPIADSVLYWTGAGSQTGGDTLNNWGYGAALSTPQSNWSGNSTGSPDALTVPTSGTTVYFTARNATPVAGALTTQLDFAYSIQGLNFDTSQATASISSVAINTNGNALTIGNGGLTVVSTDTSTTTISGTGPIIVNGNQSWANNAIAAVPLAISVPVNAASASTVLTFNGTGTGGVNLSGSISDGSGTLGLVFAQAGRTVISAASSYSGGTMLSSGTLQLSGSGTLGNTSSALTVNGGTLDLGGTSQSVGNLAGSGGTILNNGNGSVTLTIGTGNATGGNYAGTIANNTSGNGTVNLTKIGTGTLILSGNNSYGNTTITGGILNAQSNNAFGTSGVVSSVVAGAGIQLQGGITIPSGVSFTLSNSSTGSVPYSVDSISGNNTINGSINLTSGGGSMIIQSDSGALVLAGNVISINSNRALTLQGNSTAANTVSGVISDGINSRTVSVVKLGSGSWTLSNSNSYSGSTTIDSGTLVMANPNALGNSTSTGAVTLAGGTLDIATDGSDYPYNVTIGSDQTGTIASDLKTGSTGINHTLGNLAMGGSTSGNTTTLNIVAGSAVSTGTPAVTFSTLSLGKTSTGTTTLNPTTASLLLGNVTANATGSNYTKTIILGGSAAGNSISGSISDASSTVLTAITKSNSSTWTLSGASTYSAPTTVSAGNLRVNNVSGSGTGNSTVTVNGGTLGGNGTIGVSATSRGNITVNAGGLIAAGADNSTTGTLTSLSTGGVTLNGGSGYVWKINNGAGTAGATTGWDELATQGMTFAGLTPATNPFTIYLSGSPVNLTTGSTLVIATDTAAPISINGNNTIGNGTVLADSSVNGGMFVLDTSQFSTSNSGGSSFDFQLEVVGDGAGQDLALVYSSTPEPATSLLLLSGSLPLLQRRRRRPVRGARLEGEAAEA